MPLTPLHPGPALFLGSLFPSFFNYWALILGSVAMDIEPVASVIIRGVTFHGPLHSILGAIVGSLIIAAILRRFRKKLNSVSLKYKISQSFSFPVLFFSSLVAWLFHIFFDSLSHVTIRPFWPLEYNPILIGPPIYWPLNLILLISGIIALILIYRQHKKHPY